MDIEAASVCSGRCKLSGDMSSVIAVVEQDGKHFVLEKEGREKEGER